MKKVTTLVPVIFALVLFGMAFNLKAFADVREEINPELIYIDDDCSYQIIEKQYVYKDFHVKFPQVKTKNRQLDKKVNETIAKYAMASVNTMYPKYPLSEDMNRGLLQSTVEYCITYQDDNYLCVAFDDHFFVGSVFLEFMDFRSVILDMKTGEKIKLTDICERNEEFLDELCKLITDIDTDMKYDAVGIDNLWNSWEPKNALTRFQSYPILFSDRWGIGVSYHYGDGKLISRGYEIYTSDMFNKAKTKGDVLNKLYSAQ